MNFRERYKYDPVSDKLGSGGFATVFKAHDILLDREVALKIFHTTENIKVNLLSELQRMSKLDHPNLVRCHDILNVEVTNVHGLSEHLNIGVMEYANGGSLQDFIKQNKNLPVSREILIQILQGLSYLHSRSIIHRDLKPQNILFSKHGNELTAKITDFGISKALSGDDKSSSVVMGTIEYMAPEQFNPQRYGIGGRISTNLDLWSFGILTYEWITQKQLFGESNPSSEQVMNAILSFKLPEDIDRIEEPFQTVIRKCLVTDANQRVKDAKELIYLLEDDEEEITNVRNEVDAKTILIGRKEIIQGSHSQGEIKSIKQNPEVNHESKLINSDKLKPEQTRKNKLLLPVMGLIFLILVAGGIYFFRSSATNKSANLAEGNSTDSKFDTSAIYEKFKWLKPSRKYEDVFEFSDGLAKVLLNGKHGFINTNGDLVIDLKYDEAYSFSDGLAAVKINHEWGYIDKQGKISIPAKYDGVTDFSDGIAAAKNEGRWGFIDKSGRVVIPFKYAYATSFNGGLASVQETTGNFKYGFVDKTGKQVVDFIYDFAVAFHEGFAMVTQKGKYGFVDTTGKLVIECKYDDAFDFWEGLAAVQIGKNYGFIDKHGKLVIEPKFSFLGYFSEGLSAVNMDGFMGYIDKQGKVIIPFKYLKAYPFEDGIARVYIDGKSFYIDKLGREIK